MTNFHVMCCHLLNKLLLLGRNEVSSPTTHSLMVWLRAMKAASGWWDLLWCNSQIHFEECSSTSSTAIRTIVVLLFQLCLACVKWSAFEDSNTCMHNPHTTRQRISFLPEITVCLARRTGRPRGKRATCFGQTLKPCRLLLTTFLTYFFRGMVDFVPVDTNPQIPMARWIVIWPSAYHPRQGQQHERAFPSLLLHCLVASTPPQQSELEYPIQIQSNNLIVA